MMHSLNSSPGTTTHCWQSCSDEYYLMPSVALTKRCGEQRITSFACELPALYQSPVTMRCKVNIGFIRRRKPTISKKCVNGPWHCSTCSDRSWPEGPAHSQP